MPAAVDTAQCADCQQADVALHDIRKRNLCTECFVRYVNSKILKRMESYRPKNQAGHEVRRLFLPLSGGVSSAVLLTVFDAQLQRQRSKQGRTSYELVIAHVDTTMAFKHVGPEWYKALSEQFPTHTFMPCVSIGDAFATDTSLENDLKLLGVLREFGMSNDDFYTMCLSAATSATSRSDMEEIICTRLLVALARQHDCSSIVYGHSDSCLAALSLASVAKGRGGAVPAHIGDGFNQGFGINLNYPARDLFKSELELYGQLQDPPLLRGKAEDREAKHIPSIRNTSIDDLLTGYITSQGEKYPSIMANVVRTAGKLQTTEPNPAAQQIFCRFCKGTILSNSGEDNRNDLCYGCMRMKQDVRIG